MQELKEIFDKTLKVMINEEACVRRNRDTDCRQQCETCDLVLETQEVLDAYGVVITMLKDALFK